MSLSIRLRKLIISRARLDDFLRFRMRSADVSKLSIIKIAGFSMELFFSGKDAAIWLASWEEKEKIIRGFALRYFFYGFIVQWVLRFNEPIKYPPPISFDLVKTAISNKKLLAPLSCTMTVVVIPYQHSIRTHKQKTCSLCNKVWVIEKYKGWKN